jgi:site-specific DNA-methyltransferase (adenine-specific)
MRWLLRLSCGKGSRVLDPFAGSGSTAVAALAEGMEFVGIERDGSWVDCAKQRCHLDVIQLGQYGV